MKIKIYQDKMIFRIVESDRANISNKRELTTNLGGLFCFRLNFSGEIFGIEQTNGSFQINFPKTEILNWLDTNELSLEYQLDEVVVALEKDIKSYHIGNRKPC